MEELTSEFFECPITGQIIAEPVIASDGHIYENSAIKRWLAKNNTSPITRSSLDRRLYPAILHKQLINSYLEKHPEERANLFVPIKIGAYYKDEINAILNNDNYTKLVEYTQFELNLLDQKALYAFLEKCEDNRILEYFLDEVVKTSVDNNRRTILHLVCFLCEADVLRYLLDKYENDLDFEAEDINKSKAIHFACQNGCDKMVEMLLEKNIQVTCVNKWNITPLQYLMGNTRFYNLQKLANLLVDKGADYHAIDNREITPLVNALKYRKF